ncbi:MAG: FAD-binding oxidoreductase [Chloroflexi bacterium]|nr:FAD-binding oxidoreductase [Chloroflexota bacterium]
MFPDVVIIGGGIVGCSCAYYLSREGVKVHLVERGSIASGTSGACEGNILQWDKQPGIELKLGIASAFLWETLAEELPLDIEYVKKGSILVAENQEGLDSAGQIVKSLQNEGVPCQLATREDLLELEPNLAPDITGGAIFPEDAQVQPMLATIALGQAAKDQGAVIHTFTEVKNIELSPERSVVAVNTTAGRIPTRAIVNAAGVWSNAIGKMVDLDIPVLPRKGHIVVTEPVANIVNCKMMEAGYTQAVESDERGLAIAAVVEHTLSGNILLGSSREFVGFDRSVNPDVIRAIVARALRFFPALKNIHAIRTYAGLRPYTPDHRPIIAEADTVKGFYVATGHEGAGICLGPITGKLIAQMLTGQATDLPIEQLSLSRFDD